MIDFVLPALTQAVVIGDVSLPVLTVHNDNISACDEMQRLIEGKSAREKDVQHDPYLAKI